MKITHASSLTDSALIAELSRLAGQERAATVALIVHLSEFDARRLYAGAGFSSTFRYCLEVLHLSEDASFNRIEVARAARTYPLVLEMLLAGALSPTTARLLARRLTAQDHRELLAAAAGKSKQQVEELLARRFPQPDVPSSIRGLPVHAFVGGSTSDVPGAGRETSADGASGAGSPPEARQTVESSGPVAASRPLVRPLAAARYEIRFTASAETRDYLRRAQDLLGHVIPDGDLDRVFNRSLRLLVRELERKKFAATERPRRSRGQAIDSRNIPACVKRAVRKRDGDGCAWVASNGRRCGERRFLEFHHDDPWGVGGQPTSDRVRLLCRAHNAHEAEVFYGPGRRYDRGGADVAREASGRYGALTKKTPVLGRVDMKYSPRCSGSHPPARAAGPDSPTVVP